MPATVIRFEYDPYRTANIMLVEYEDKTQSYLIAPQDIKVGTKIHSGRKKDIEIGNCMPLIDIPPATVVHNVEMRPHKKFAIILIAAWPAATPVHAPLA